MLIRSRPGIKAVGSFFFSCCHDSTRFILVTKQVGSSDKAVSKQLTAMGVTDRNILIFLAQIEEQIEHIVQVSTRRFLETKLTNKKGQVHLPNLTGSPSKPDP